MANKRDTSKDGFRNNLESYALSHLKPLWTWIQSNESVKKKVNKKLINNAILKIPTRPYASLHLLGLPHRSDLFGASPAWIGMPLPGNHTWGSPCRARIIVAILLAEAAGK
jgi:hypothetical protein